MTFGAAVAVLAAGGDWAGAGGGTGASGTALATVGGVAGRVDAAVVRGAAVFDGGNGGRVPLLAADLSGGNGFLAAGALLSAGPSTVFRF